MKDFFTQTLFVQLIASFIGSCAFAVVFKINKRHLLHVGILGFITYFVYYTMMFFTKSAFASAFVSTAAATLCAELLARRKHAPTIVYLVTGLIPIVPGADSYYSMKYLLEQNSALATEKLLATVQVALGIAGGIVVISILFSIIRDKLEEKRSKHKN